MGFESLFMQCWRAREMILDISEMTSGHRIIQSTSIIGGVRRDIDEEMAKEVETRLADFKDMMDHTISPTVYNDYTIKRRTVGKGPLSTEQAKLLGAVGPTLRASNVPLDIRQTGYAAYKETGFEPIVEPDGDSYARTVVRVREIYQSRELILKALSLMPEGEISIRVKGNPPEGEVIHRAEQPRGEVVYYIKGNGTPNLERLRVRTPTFANIPPLLAMLPGCELADVPVITLSIDPCIACTER
jgi:ech hydrogenase subunit E